MSPEVAAVNMRKKVIYLCNCNKKKKRINIEIILCISKVLFNIIFFNHVSKFGTFWAPYW